MRMMKICGENDERRSVVGIMKKIWGEKNEKRFVVRITRVDLW